MKKGIIILLLLSLISCARHYKIPDEYYNLIPYNGNELMVFKSDNNKFDTLNLVGILSKMQAEHATSKNKVEIRAAQYNHRFTDNNKPFIKTNYLISTHVNANYNIHLKVNLETKHALFNSDYISLEQYNMLAQQSIVYNSQKLNDIVIFPIDSFAYNNWPSENVTMVTSLYWSKSKGLMKYVTDKGETWMKIK